MNFVRDVVAAQPPGAVAVVERTRSGARNSYSFADMTARCAAMSAVFARHGVGRGDVVAIVVGNRVEWVDAMLACFHLGAVALACTEQLRPDDLARRFAVAGPRLVVVDERDEATVRQAQPGCPVVVVPDPRLLSGGGVPPPADLDPADPCLLTFTSGTTGEPKAALHAQRYLSGQRLQARHWLGVRASDLVWCTAPTGWSKSARNAFVAPWLAGACVLLVDARFDPQQRLDMVREESVTVLCMAPTEYRGVAARCTIPALPSLRGMVAAGEALDAATLTRWREAVGLDIRDGYGQTETGQLTANPAGVAARPGSMGRALPGVRLRVEDGELVVDPASVPTFFSGYLGSPPPDGPWRTGDRVRVDQDGYLYFDARTDDVIISAGYRIGPFEVEAVLSAHPAVAEAAVVAAPDAERGSLVRAVVVLRSGYRPSASLAAALQQHVRDRTAPYKYPRRVDFVEQLPKTPSGKIRRAELRAAGAGDPDQGGGGG